MHEEVGLEMCTVPLEREKSIKRKGPSLFDIMGMPTKIVSIIAAICK